MRRKHYTEEEKARKRAEDRERLAVAAAELLTTEGWQRWVQTRSAFHHYSLGNTLLIASQRPDATRVAGFKTWKTLGRAVRKGERGIRIQAPITVKVRDEETDETDERKVITRFRFVSVFDVAQTDPIPGADPAPLVPPHEPIAGDSHEYVLAPLEAHANTLGYSVSYEHLPGGVGGYCDGRSKRIVVEAGEPANARVRTLVHEIAHAHGITYETHSRDEAEVIVDTATYVACSALGLDTSGETIPYIAGWGERGALEAVTAAAERIDEIARTIEQAATGEQPAQPAAPQQADQAEAVAA